MDNELERLDDLQLNGLQIIQNKKEFCFGMDAVLLSEFAKPGKNSCCLDMCCGNGIIAFLLHAKYAPKKIVGIDLQSNAISLAKRTAAHNDIKNEAIEFFTLDVLQLSAHFPAQSFDYITVNPPYMKKDAAFTNENLALAIARHELFCTMDDILMQASKLLAFRGKIALIQKTQRFSEILCKMKAHRLEPKRLQMIHPSMDKASKLFMIEAVFEGKEDLRVMPPLIISNGKT